MDEDPDEARAAAVTARLDALLGRLGGELLGDLRLLANPVLSRSPYASRLWERLAGEEVPATRPSRLWFWLALVPFYLRNLAHFLRHLALRLRIRRLVRCKGRWVPRGTGTVYITSAFVVVDDVVRAGRFEERFMPGLHETLDHARKEWVFLPVLSGWHPWGPTGRSLRLMMATGMPMLWEHDLLTCSDLLRSLVFILSYPFAVLRAIGHCGDAPEERMAVAEFAATFGRTICYEGHLRYLAGRRMAGWGRPLRLISYYENQSGQWFLHRGLRDARADCRIYGCMSLVRSPTQAWLRPIASEERHGLLPDVILVNGPHYLRDRDVGLRAEFRLAPSFRYAWLFSHPRPVDHEAKTILLVLPMFTADCVGLLSCCLASVLASRTLTVKFHPCTPEKERMMLRRGWPAAWRTTDSPLREAVTGTLLVVTIESGGALECAAAGVPVVIVANGTGLAHNPMPPFGRGEIWTRARDAGELDATVLDLIALRRDHPARIDELADLICRECFTPPTTERIRKAFDL